MINEIFAAFSAIVIGSSSISADYSFEKDKNTTKIIFANKFQSERIAVNTLNISFENERNRLIELLDEFAQLEDNWNGNGAKPFGESLIRKCKEIVNKLTIIPEIFPVANNSIQLEYEKKDGGYLQFNIFEHEITMFTILEDGKPFYDKLFDVNNIIKEVQKFYEGI